MQEERERGSLVLSQKSVKTEGQYSHGYIPDTVTEM